MRQLVASWVQAERELHGNNLAQALRKLNGWLGTSYTHSRVSQWKRGIYTPQPKVLSLMLRRALPWMLKQSGTAVSAAQLAALIRLIWVVSVENGETHGKLL